MTKKELIEALADYPDSTLIYIPGSATAYEGVLGLGVDQSYEPVTSVAPYPFMESLAVRLETE